MKDRLLNDTQIGVLFKKKQAYFEAKYPNLKAEWFKKNRLWHFKIMVNNFTMKVSKGFKVENREQRLLMKSFEVLEKSLNYTAMHWFLSKKSPKKNKVANRVSIDK